MSRRTCEAAWLAAIAFGWGAACAGPGFSPERVPDEQRAAYEAALAKPPSGPGATQAKALEAFIAAYPASPMADDAALRLSELAFEDGRQDDGLRWLGSVLTQYPGSDREPTARLRVAELEYARDRRVAARGLLDPVDVRRLSPEDARAALRLRVALAQTPVERMQNLAKLRTALRDDAKRARGDVRTAGPLEAQQREVDREIDELIASAADPELEVMLENLDRRSPSGAVALELARRSVAEGAADEAQRLVDRAGRLAEGEGERERARSLAEELARRPAVDMTEAPVELAPLRELSQYTRRDTRGAEGTLGVVLPLSGDFAEFGEASLRGILLAAGVFAAGGTEASNDTSDPRDRPNMRIVVRDSGAIRRARQPRCVSSPA